jgi:hypothetical protein
MLAESDDANNSRSDQVAIREAADPDFCMSVGGKSSLARKSPNWTSPRPLRLT